MAKKRKKAVKQKGIRELQKEADEWFSRYLRLWKYSNGINRCMTCDKRLEPKDAHAGHFISRNVLQLRYEEENVFLQCYYCNMHDNEYAHIVMTVKLIDAFGMEYVKRMVKEKHMRVPFSVKDYECFIETFKERTEELLKRVDIEAWWKTKKGKR